MLRTIEATIDKNGEVKLAETVALDGVRRALVTILDEPPGANETMLLSEQALAVDWLRPEEEEAWKHLQKDR